MGAPGNVEDKLAQLRRLYLEQLPAKAAEISDTALLLANMSDTDVSAYLDKMEAVSHKLAGSGATYGYPEISEAAKALETSCATFLRDGLEDAEQELSATRKLESALHDVITGIVRDAEETHQQSDEAKQAELAAPETGRTVAVIGAGGEDLRRISDELSDFDLSPCCFDVDGGLATVLVQSAPLGIILDIDMGAAADVALETIGKLKQSGKLLCPLIVLSKNGDIETRLKAARAHSKHFLVNPVMTQDIVDILDRMVIADGGDNFRVLIVDDDSSTARYTQAVLQAAGMIVEYITEPMKLVDTLDDFLPELILMDLYMPECTGQELAAVVRQQESFSGVPIVFLSGEANVDKQLVAMHSGADDFLTKPIKSNHLISSVRMRVQRFRVLRSQMVRDGMTGLLNHTTAQEFLVKEVSRAQRNKAPLAVASLDIDHFKSVNDTHGHSVGDVVIKSLSRLLKQRLRATDIIGRMGGEEFAAVLPATTAAQALSVLEQIRQDFSEIEHKSEAGDFSVTLSCGIAEYPAHQTPVELLEASDVALYKAKNGGRNRVVLGK